MNTFDVNHFKVEPSFEDTGIKTDLVWFKVENNNIYSKIPLNVPPDVLICFLESTDENWNFAIWSKNLLIDQVFKLENAFWIQTASVSAELNWSCLKSNHLKEFLFSANVDWTMMAIFVKKRIFMNVLSLFKPLLDDLAAVRVLKILKNK